LYAVGRRIDKTGAQGGLPSWTRAVDVRGLSLQHLYQLSCSQKGRNTNNRRGRRYLQHPFPSDQGSLWKAGGQSQNKAAQ